MPKNKNKYSKCPCCGVEKHRTEMKEALASLVEWEKKQLKHYEELNTAPKY